MIVKIELMSKEGNYITMLFGDSYKKWFDQFQEYVNMFLPKYVVDVKVSKEKWKDWGGLKWCSHDEFQEELNREGCQDGESDNPNPRIYANFEFNESVNTYAKANTIVIQRNYYLYRKNAL